MAAKTYYLSDLIGRPVRDPRGHPVGLVGDLVVVLTGPFPPVFGLTLRVGGFGRNVRPLATFMHWNQVASVSSEGLTLSSARLDLQPFRRRQRELLLDADLMDQQVMDLDGHKLVRVNDVQLAPAGTGGTDLRLAGIDVGALGLFRRLGGLRFASWLAVKLSLHVQDRVIPWEDVDPVDLADLPPEMSGDSVEAGLGAGRGGLGRGVRLTHEKLAALHPADVAELVAQLAAPDRAAVLESLEAEQAAETIGELDPEMRGDVLEDMPTDAALEILSELPPDEAADALAEMSEERADELLGGMEAADAEAVRELMNYPEDDAGGMMSNAYIALAATLTAAETIDVLRRLSPPSEEVYAIYVVDSDGKLVGSCSLRDLIVAPVDATLGDIIADYDEVPHVATDASRDEIVEMIDKYDLLALPVTDESGQLVGVITVDDALASLLPDERSRILGVRR
jgi:CBS domain-containing protein/sporulation protein YlmC with PRC-barrel domain